MKQITTLSLLLSIPVLLSAQAQESWAQAKAGYLKQLNASCLADKSIFGLGGGTWVTDQWGWEADLMSAELRIKASDLKGRESHLLGSALYNLRPGTHSWYPYLRAGLGVAKMDAPISLEPGNVTRLAFHGGVGAQYFFKDHGISSLEVRTVKIQNNAGRAELQLLAGLGYRWSGAMPKLASIKTEAPPEEIQKEPVPPPPPTPQPPPPVVQKPAEPAEPVAAPVVAPLPSRIVLDEAVLHFANGRTELDTAAVLAIRKVAESLKAYQGEFSLRVTGYTSSVGSANTNIALSKRRAEAVAKVLVESGVPAARVTSLGRGPENPIALNTSREGQAKNRRVEIDVITGGASVDVRKSDTSLVDPATAPKPKAAGPKKAARKTK